LSEEKASQNEKKTLQQADQPIVDLLAQELQSILLLDRSQIPSIDESLKTPPNSPERMFASRKQRIQVTYPSPQRQPQVPAPCSSRLTTISEDNKDTHMEDEQTSTQPAPKQ